MDIENKLKVFKKAQNPSNYYKIDKFIFDVQKIQKLCSKNSQYIGYSSYYDEIDDYGWGCAWRSI